MKSTGEMSRRFLVRYITLMEDDKRLGAAEALKAILPYSKREFRSSL